ncbi:hypothetical protein ACFV4F_24330 [Kitasatospora sp. NPDC059722]|uniref:hypothetical protein n=1 Tax=Kitasatospora sp. NPDC059722 TaxID=3346925 RepID=UPI00369DB2B9
MRSAISWSTEVTWSDQARVGSEEPATGEPADAPPPPPKTIPIREVCSGAPPRARTRLARLRWRSDTGTAHTWNFLPSASSSTEYPARSASTAAHGAVIVRHGLRTTSRRSLASTAGRSV